MQRYQPQFIAWIPTNLGELRKDIVVTPHYKRINDYLYCLEKDFYDTSDSFLPELRRKQESLFVDFFIDFEQEHLGYWKFELKIYIKTNPNEELIKAYGTIYLHGKITFAYSLSSSIDEKNSDLTNLPNTIFTYIKRRVHVDLHHKEKVDNVIPVLHIQDKDLFFQKTYNALAQKIKSIELDAKRIYRDNDTYLKFSIIESLYYDALGFYAYLQAFEKLFSFENRNNLKLLDAESVILSLEALNKKVQIEKSTQHLQASLIIAVVTLFISLHILTHNEFFVISNYAVSTVIILIFVILFAEILHRLYRGIGLFSYIFLPKPEAKEYYQRLYIAGSIDPKKLKSLPLRHRFLYWFLRYGVYIVGVAMIVVAILLLKELQISVQSIIDTEHIVPWKIKILELEK